MQRTRIQHTCTRRLTNHSKFFPTRITLVQVTPKTLLPQFPCFSLRTRPRCFHALAMRKASPWQEGPDSTQKRLYNLQETSSERRQATPPLHFAIDVALVRQPLFHFCHEVVALARTQTIIYFPDASLFLFGFCVYTHVALLPVQAHQTYHDVSCSTLRQRRSKIAATKWLPATTTQQDVHGEWASDSFILLQAELHQLLVGRSKSPRSKAAVNGPGTCIEKTCAMGPAPYACFLTSSAAPTPLISF